MSRSPNVILIIADDQGYGDWGCHGNPWLQTPNLDRMYAESVRLDNHHGEPLCSPSRAALLTGQYSTRGGVWHVVYGRHLLDARALTMADVFSENGYRTAMYGKWHLGDNYPYHPENRGFHEVVTHRGGGVGELPDYWGNDYHDDTYFRNGNPEAFAGYCTDVFFSEAMQFIEANQAQPFFMYLATNAMHWPFIVPEAYASPYRESGVPDERARFYGMVTNYDENVGRLLAQLDRLNLSSNTIVITTADHGTAAGFDPATGEGFNAGMRGKKASVYDGGHRIAFFMRWPMKLPAGRTIKHITSHMDILPTLIELCQLEVPHGSRLDGMSLVPLFEHDGVEWPERSIIVQLQPDHPEKWHHCVVMTDRWRLVNGHELYDMMHDPSQQTDVANVNSIIVDDLRLAYDRWWDDMSPAWDEYAALSIGHPAANPTVLCARDWHPTSGQIPWMQEWIGDTTRQANGYLVVEIVKDGRYEFRLRRYPDEAGYQPLGATQARLQIGDINASQLVVDNQSEAVFTLDLEAGQTFMQTWLVDEATDTTRGAYYVYVERLTH